MVIAELELPGREFEQIPTNAPASPKPTRKIRTRRPTLKRTKKPTRRRTKKPAPSPQRPRTKKPVPSKRTKKPQRSRTKKPQRARTKKPSPKPNRRPRPSRPNVILSERMPGYRMSDLDDNLLVEVKSEQFN